MLLFLVLGRVINVFVLVLVIFLMSVGVLLVDEIVVGVVDLFDVGISIMVLILFVFVIIGFIVFMGGVIYFGVIEFLEK